VSLVNQAMGGPKCDEYHCNVNKSFAKLEGFCLKNQESLKKKAIQTLESRGCHVFLVSNAEKAVDKIAEIAQSGRIVTCHDPQIEALGIHEKLQKRGVRVQGTNVEGFERGEINHVWLKMRQEIAESAFGLTGVQAVVANHGSLMLMDERGSVHTVSALPYKHIAVAKVQQIVPDLADAMIVARSASLGKTDRKLVRYISIVTGPSSTSDIEGKNVRGMHGPKEVYVILVEE